MCFCRHAKSGFSLEVLSKPQIIFLESLDGISGIGCAILYSGKVSELEEKVVVVVLGSWSEGTQRSDMASGCGWVSSFGVFFCSFSGAVGSLVTALCSHYVKHDIF